MKLNPVIPMEFAATECMRPEVAERSWASFTDKLRGVDWETSTLYMNLDPVPRGVEAAAMVSVAECFFGHVICRYSKEPNFAAAFKWAWMQPKGNVFFYLQADWLLERPIEITDMLAILTRYPSLVALNLRAYANIRDRLCLSPVLIRRKAARPLAAAMNTLHSPEAQLRAPSFRKGGQSLGIGVKSYHWPQRVIIKDIGRAWMQEHKLRKAGGTGFVRWEGK